MAQSGNNAAAANQPEQPHPHPVLEKLTGVQYCINSPPPLLEAVFLGFQHYILSLGSIVLIPSMKFLKWVVVMLFSPLSMVPLVLFTGLGLYLLGFPLIAKCVEVGNPELVFMIVISQVIKINVPFPFQWGPPTVRAGEIFATVMAAFVASTESTGLYLAAARYGSDTPVPPSVISRGIGWLGIGTLLNGLFGSVTGATATAENVGLLALTKAGSRRVVQISAAFMIFFSILGKFGAIFASIPLPIMAGIYCICFGYVASAGLGFLQFCNLNNFRTKLVLGFYIFLGLSLSQYFREYRLHSSTGPIHTHAHGYALPHGSDGAHKDNGAYWWEMFMVYNNDGRNNELYKLPGSFSKFFPAF
ncbi:nucleobase-ascorbate transporter 10 [Olea europaea subsp. europaea]|uniref:Nucleobase-ascorbate transporter 10 n=1 Tax=Olea europaea subsp. europaea TaxID=158383 RepID=A0A8S0QHA3_OLEEU|nr:nucleobase-ascorbate transporter 10 [Olea europaea subsp. europaea]